MSDICEHYRNNPLVNNPIMWTEKFIQDDESAKWKKILEKKALAYENGKILGNAIEVEIGVFRGEVWICDHNQLADDAAFIEKVCTTEKITIADIDDLCEKHNWW